MSPSSKERGHQGSGRPTHRHRHLPVHRHRGLHQALGARRPQPCRMPSPATTRSCDTPSRLTAATSSRPSATPSAAPSRHRHRRPGSGTRRPAGAPRRGVGREIGAIRVRMALHTGAAEERGGDYFGPPVNRVARLLSAGHGGQILLSQAAQELVRDDLPEGATLRDLGERRLKDLFRPESVFQLIAPATCRELPAPEDPRREDEQPSAAAHPAGWPGEGARGDRGPAAPRRGAAAHPHGARRHGQDAPGPAGRRPSSWTSSTTACSSWRSPP